jgi:hypothetical protein
MKRNIMAVLASVSMAVAAFGTPLEFQPVKIAMPAASLMEDALQKAPTFVSDFERNIQSQSYQEVIVSHMPIVTPKNDIDARMLKAPDASIDYELSVLTPKVVPAK